MTYWIRWTAPAIIAVTTVCPVQAVEYLSVPAAQKLAFPGASQFAELEPGRSWKAMAGERLLGLFVLDHVIGKHLSQLQNVDCLRGGEPALGGKARCF